METCRAAAEQAGPRWLQQLEVKSPGGFIIQQLCRNAPASISPITWLGTAGNGWEQLGQRTRLETSAELRRLLPPAVRFLSLAPDPFFKKVKSGLLNLDKELGRVALLQPSPRSHARPGRWRGDQMRRE